MNANAKPRSMRSYSLGDIFRVPLLLCLLSLVGLVAALVGDGWLDVMSWATLAVPLWVIMRKLQRARSH